MQFDIVGSHKNPHAHNLFLKTYYSCRNLHLMFQGFGLNTSFQMVMFHLLKTHLTIRDQGDNATSVTELLTLLYVFQIEDICEPLLSLAVWCMDDMASVRTI